MNNDQGAIPRTIAIHRNDPGGLIATLLGILFGVIGIFAIAVLFVPLSLICGLLGLFRSRSISAVALSALALLLSVVGYFMSPVLLAMTGALLVTKAISDAAPPVQAPRTQQMVAQVTPPPAAKMMPKVIPPAGAPPSASEKSGSIPERTEEPQVGAGEEMRWVEITKPMVACRADEDTPELRQRTFQAIVAWRSGTKPPPGCGMIKPGTKLIDFDDQTEDERRELLRLAVPNCKKSCVPFSSPVYMPPWQLFGAYARYSSPPPGW